MPNPSTRQIYLPNYKLNITVPTEYSDIEIDAAIQRNKAQIQQASPVFAQGRRYLQNALGPEDAGNGLRVPALGITEQQARAQGIGPAVAAQAAQDNGQYSDADQRALLRHYAAQKAINSANQRPPQAAQAALQANLLPPDRLTAIGDRAARAVSEAVQRPLLNSVLDYGAPGASRQLDGMQGYGAGLARGALGFSSPGALGTMALLGPVAAEPMGMPLLLGAFGAPAVAGAYRRAQSGDVGGALGELTAFGLPLAVHGARLAQAAKNAADYRAGGRWMDENFGVDAEPPPQPLLPGLDPNVYEADFQPDRPTGPASPDLAVASVRSAEIPQIASGLSGDGFGVDPAGDMMRQTMGPEVPTPYGQELIPLPANANASRLLLPKDIGSETSTQDSGVAPYMPTAVIPREGSTRLPAVSDWLPDSATSSSDPLSGVMPAAPVRFPMTITFGEARALSSLLGEQSPFTVAMDQLFAEGKKNADLTLTLPQLTSLRSLAAQTTSMLGNGPGSYSRPTLIKRLNLAKRNFPDSSENSVVDPHTSEGGSAFGQQPIFDPMRRSGTSVQLGSLKSTVQKRIRIDSIRRGSDDVSIAAQLQSRTGDSEDFDSYPGQGRVVHVQSDPAIGARLRNGRNALDTSDNETATRSVPLALAPAQSRQVKNREAAVLFNELSASEKASLPDPRFFIEETLANGHLSAEWWESSMSHVAGITPQRRVLLLQDVLEGETLRRAKYALRRYPVVLHSPVVYDDYLPDDIAGRIWPTLQSTSGYKIVLNGRMWHDPEDILLVIVEEAMHIAQVLTKRSFDFSLPYNQRAHEGTAKQGAQYVVGRPKQTYNSFSARTHPDMTEGEVKMASDLKEEHP